MPLPHAAVSPLPRALRPKISNGLRARVTPTAVDDHVADIVVIHIHAGESCVQISSK